MVCGVDFLLKVLYNKSIKKGGNKYVKGIIGNCLVFLNYILRSDFL